MKETVANLVAPHLLRVIELASQAEKGVNVDWHVRGVVMKTLADLDQHYNGPELTAAYIDGLDVAAAQAQRTREDYVRVLRAAAAVARNPR